MVQPLGSFHDDWRWLKSAFVVSLGMSYEDYEEMVLWRASDEVYGGIPAPILSEVSEEKGNNPPVAFVTRRKCRDTSLGGNDAINCLYAYNEDDDVTYPMLFSEVSGSGDNVRNTHGLGRVYNAAFDENQQILYISCGLPEYNNAASFYKDIIVPKLAGLMNGGSAYGATDFGYLIGSVAVGLITLPFLPLMYINQLINRLTTVKITKYYDFRPEMPLYYRLVNSMILHLAANMGLNRVGLITERDSNRTGSNTTASTALEVIAQSNVESGNNPLPDIFSRAGWDIYRILSKKFVYQGSTNWSKLEFTDQAMMDNYERKTLDVNGEPVSDDKSSTKYWWESLFLGFKAQAFDTSHFVGFRVERSIDTSESISNSTTTSPVAEAINAKQQAIREAKHAIFHGRAGNNFVFETIGAAAKAVGGAMSGALDAIGLGGPSHLVTGAGMVDIPEVWSDSSFSKDYNFTLKLESIYGDPYSIFQNLYIPLALVFGMAAPRSIGPNMYTSPFVIRAYSKGMVSCPLGMISNLSIRRGSDTHGWTVQKLPTTIELSFGIKDLSPGLHMGIGSGRGDGILSDIADAVAETFGETSNFQEYLLMLAGIGLRERLAMSQRFYRSIDKFLNMAWNQRLNPTAAGVWLAGGTRVGSLVSLFIPSKLPGN